MADFHYVGSVAQRTGTDGMTEYVGVVCRNDSGHMTVLNMGVEDTREGIVQWVRDTIQMKRDMGRDDVQAADKYDRMGVVKGHVQTVQ
ncbi:MAG TPA: hypothetical protein VF077_01045 [Nitrospiraceae bacterium]